MKKNYNYTRRKLYLPEYGRHIQEMIDSLLEIEDRRERNRQARAVIAVMGNLNPLPARHGRFHPQTLGPPFHHV